MADLVESYLPHVAKAEGAVTHLYLDSKGHLTIGYGHLVFHKDELKKANWQQTLTNEIQNLWGVYHVVSVPANRRQIWSAGTYAPQCHQAPPRFADFLPASVPPDRCEAPRSAFALSAPPLGMPEPSQAGHGATRYGFDNPRAFQPGHNVQTMVREAEQMLKMSYGANFPASYFRFFTSFEMGTADIKALKYADIHKKIKEVKAQPNFRDFDSMPLEGQLAILDLAYQGGAEMIAKKYKGGAFGKAVLEHRWYDAWKLCPGEKEGWPPDSRQKMRRDWLIDALKGDPKSTAGNWHMYRKEVLGWEECTKNF